MLVRDPPFSGNLSKFSFVIDNQRNGLETRAKTLMT